MKKRNVWITALSALLVLALGIGLWSGGVFAPKEAKLSVPTERRMLPADPSAPEAEADEAADALPLAATAAEQKPWTPPIQNLVTESIGAPSEEIPTEQLITEPADVTNPEILEDETVTYDGEHFLVKLVPESDGAVTPALAAAGVTALEPMMRLDNGAWFLAYVGEGGDVKAAVEAARGAEGVLVAEYDFASQTMAEMPMAESVADCVRENPRVMEAWHLRACGIQEAWQYQAQNDLPVAGAGTIVAVIDTGVDYTHKELAASMWQNPNEIPDNGVDDDGNGYVDDYYGVDVVSGKGSGNDDHGHGTHVAGIIAAANNKEGTVGIAYNAKIMNVKAGQSSGYFLQSDIAKAIVYAFENGADVINMSFGGTTSSLAVQDALTTAYTHCVLVAAAGNNGIYNEGMLAIPNFPAAFPYVLGVMSVDQNGVESVFTNWDLTAFNQTEYEVYAPGGQILSTIPGDRYAVWSGTSMAAPVVASIAAMLRADLPDLGSYPTKFIYGQIAGTGTFTPACCDPDHHGLHNIPPVCDAVAALTVMPHPELGVSDYLIYDTEGFAAQNDGDGVIDAGETVALGFTLRNRWGMSKDTLVTVDALSPAGIPCPYVTFSTDASDPGGESATVNYGSVGTYSEGDCGKLYSETGDRITGWENPFYLHVSPDCPNDYCIALNVQIHAKNALDETDSKDYAASGRVELIVRRGVILTGIITEDTTLTAENYYIVPSGLIVDEGVTVTVEPGTQIQFWSSDAQDAYASSTEAYIYVRGTMRFNGTEESPIALFPSDWKNHERVTIQPKGLGDVELRHCVIKNPGISASLVENCELSPFDNFSDNVNYPDSYSCSATHITGCAFDRICCFITGLDTLPCSFDHNVLVDSRIDYSGGNSFSGDGDRTSQYVSMHHNVFLGNTYVSRNYNGYEKLLGSTLRWSFNVGYFFNGDGAFSASVSRICYDPVSRTTYFVLSPNTKYRSLLDPAIMQSVARQLGGQIAVIESEEELAFLDENWLQGATANYYRPQDQSEWMVYGDGTVSTPVFPHRIFHNSSMDGLTKFYLPLGVANFADHDTLTDDTINQVVFEIPNTNEGEITEESVMASIQRIVTEGECSDFYHNAILNRFQDTDVSHWMRFEAAGGTLSQEHYLQLGFAGNYWGTTDETLINKMVIDFDDDVRRPDINTSNFLTEPPEDVWPFVTDVEILNQAGERVTTVGNEPLTFRVHFNRDMDTSIDLSVKFGSYYPYADYEIDGEWTDARTWEGSTTLTTLIENGTQYLRIGNGHAADAPMKLYDDYGRFTFTIDTTAAQAMIMQGSADDNGILLTWYQDDFDTLAGYNVYRSTSEDGFYQRLNSAVIPADVKEFYDDTVEPGKVYYYNFTVVKTDLTESTPSGKVTVMAKDTMAPVMYHTPVYQAFAGQKVVVNATVTDNVAVQSVKLYFRQTGETEWNVMEMTKLNDKYYANISAAFVTMQGLEYYIEATDGITKVNRGTAEAPYTVTVQEAVDLTDKGDVNGDGRITNLDALMLLQAVNDRLNLDAAQFARADINDNGELEAVEALRILHYVSGKVTSILF